MCGIAGIVGQGSPEERVAAVADMTRRLAHRGPDGEGLHNADCVSLGHRRLAIIDPQSGKQPLCNEDGSVWLTYNGEIYNYKELRAELIAHGHTFRTNSDSEVIVHAWEQWGADCVRRFRGMFAFAIVDQKARRLLLARDQLGIKPLFYRQQGECISFASELAALLATSESTPAVDVQAIEFFLRYRYIPAPDTGYESIRKLPPATYQVYDFSGTLLSEEEYWKLEFQPDTSRSADQIAEQFEETLMESVKAHLVADVPFGAFLSGGVDSTLVVMCMARLMDQKVRAYTIDFDEETYSERKYATQAADRLGIELHHEVVRPDVVGTLERLFSNYGEPFADTSAVPTWWVCELARRDVPMVLSGDGADEAFAGYGRYGRWLDDSFQNDAANLLKYPKRMFGRIAESIGNGFSMSRSHRWENRFVGMFDRNTRQQLWASDRRELTDVPCPAFAKAAREATAADKLTFAQYTDIKTYLPGDILTKVDIASMQQGLEVRTPFTDVRVMEFAATLPSAQRIDRLDAKRNLKAVPKRMLRAKFPAKFVDRPKQGFAIPESGWMQKGNPVRSCFDDLVASAGCPLFEFFDRSAIHALRDDFDARGKGATELWTVFALGLWMNNRSASDLRRAA